MVRARRSSDEAQGAVTATGHGLSTNIIEASLEAYLGALDKLVSGTAGVVTGAATPARAPEAVQ